MRKLLLATRNRNKAGEFRQFLGEDFELTDLTAFPEALIPPETGQTFEENAALKAIAASHNRHLLAIADDSGLEVEALGGAPGIYSARYAGENASDSDNVDKLLDELRARNAKGKNRLAQFRCVIAVARDGKLLGTFEGVVAGRIVDRPRGTNGFGYDPVFQPNGFEQTFAEMPAELKNKISHRARAVTTLRETLGEMKN